MLKYSVFGSVVCVALCLSVCMYMGWMLAYHMQISKIIKWLDGRRAEDDVCATFNHAHEHTQKIHKMRARERERKRKKEKTTLKSLHSLKLHSF